MTSKAVCSFKKKHESSNIHVLPRSAASRPARQYEFPTGYNAYFGPERFTVGEQFFFHSPHLVVCCQVFHLHYRPKPIIAVHQPKPAQKYPRTNQRLPSCMRSRIAPGSYGQCGPYGRREFVRWFRRPPEQRAWSEFSSCKAPPHLSFLHANLTLSGGKNTCSWQSHGT
jgi:hypothetical protein